MSDLYPWQKVVLAKVKKTQKGRGVIILPRTQGKTAMRTELRRQLMVDNQHKKIKGYRDLTEYEIAMMNEIKLLGSRLGGLVDELRQQPHFDQRWVAEGNTDLQKGIMCLVRAVARPESF